MTLPPLDVGHARIPGDGPLRIGLISDTHIPEACPELWPQVFEAFRGVDLILHGGDIHELRVLDQLAELAPVYAARGNGEEGGGGRPIAAPDERVHESWVLDVAGIRIGIIHDLPVPEHPPYLTVARAMQRRLGVETLDVIVHGDTHVERIDQIGATLCINPGSPTYPHNLETQLGTIGFLDIDGRTITASLAQLTEAGYAIVAEYTHDAVATHTGDAVAQ
ncbi:MAG: phosphodiesterase, family [Jatrophihabitantaceae bacterium]|nr:phosphodiesterase, family [Jatrophihabitantaceae bacterium]